MTECKCVNCSNCKHYRTNWRSSRTEVFCRAENQEYINKYFTEHKIKKMPGFIGYANRDVFPVKRTPKWCPLNDKNYVMPAAINPMNEFIKTANILIKYAEKKQNEAQSAIDEVTRHIQSKYPEVTSEYLPSDVLLRSSVLHTAPS